MKNHITETSLTHRRTARILMTFRQTSFFVFTLCSLCLCGEVLSAQGIKAKAAQTGVVSFGKDVRPIFQSRCVVCHSAATVSNVAISGGLALDSIAGVKQGAAGQKPQPIVVAGKSAGSELYKRLIASSASKLMPKGGPPLPAAQIALIKKWIDSGAADGDASKEKIPAVVSAEEAPMPRNHPALDVLVPTRLDVPADLRDKSTPPNTPLMLALKVGPLPPVTALAYSPDGKKLAIGGYRAVAIWDTVTGQPVACLTHLPGAVLSLAFRPDGSQLAVGGGTPGVKGEVRVYDTRTYMLVGKPLGGHSDVVVSVCWNTDGARLATGSQDKTARIWEWPSAKEGPIFKDHSDAVTRVCFSPDGKSLYTASMDHNVRRYDVEKGTLIRLFTGHNEAVTALAVNPNGKSIVTSGVEPNLRWWNVETGDTTNNNGGHGGPVNEIVFSKDGTIVVSASADKTIRLWDGGNTQQKRALEGSGDWTYTAAITPDNKFTAGAGADGLVRIWETAAGRLRLSLFVWPPAEKSGKPDWASLTPEGFYDASPSWAAKLHLMLGGKPVNAPHLADFVHTLQQPESVSKSWQGAAIDPAKLPLPKTNPPK